MKTYSPSLSGVFMILSTSAAFYLACASLLAGAVPDDVHQYDPFTGADYFLRYGFEEGDDLDFDAQPDDWTARKGPGFPHYVVKQIDQSHGKNDSRQSLRFDIGGGRAIYYAPPQTHRPVELVCARGLSANSTAQARCGVNLRLLLES